MENECNQQRVLLVNQVFHPDVAATAVVATDLARELSKRGARVTVLCSGNAYLKNAPATKSSADVLSEVTVVRIRPVEIRSRTRVARILNSILAFIAFAFRLPFLGKFDRVITMTSPPMISVITTLFARCAPGGRIYWVMDLNPAQVFAAGWLSEHSVLGKILRAFHRFVLRHSGRIFVLDEYMKTRLASEGARRIEVLPLWADFDSLTPRAREDNPFRVAHRFLDKFIVMYSGNLSLCHPLETVLSAAKEMGSDSNTIFLFIGGGARWDEVDVFRRKHDLSNIIMLPYLPPEELQFSLSAADVHIVSMGAEFVGIVHPSKVYPIMAVGRPFIVLGPEKSAPADLREWYPYVSQVNHGDVAKLLTVIQSYKTFSPSAESLREGTTRCRARFGKEVALRNVALRVLGSSD